MLHHGAHILDLLPEPLSLGNHERIFIKFKYDIKI
jgi:hypothetical protein